MWMVTLQTVVCAVAALYSGRATGEVILVNSNFWMSLQCNSVTPLYSGHIWFETVPSVLIREVPLFQRWYCTHLYVAGTVGTVLIGEVSLFQG